MENSSKFSIEYSTAKILTIYPSQKSIYVEYTILSGKNDREIFKTFICGMLKAIAAVRNIENLVEIAYFHFAVSTGQTLYPYTASNILLAVTALKLT